MEAGLRQIHVVLSTLGFASPDIHFYPLKIFRLKVRSARRIINLKIPDFARASLKG